VPDGSTPPPDSPTDYVPGTWPGSRAPHLWLAPDRSVLDLFGRGFVLLVTQGMQEWTPLLEAAAARRLPCRLEAVAAPGVAERYRTRATLVRPDGHVAWRGDALPADCLALVDTVRGASATAPHRSAS
jgi:hypothetical protein